ncbi:MAG: TIR domain-containing protein [Saprospiraceae bacterium]|nr:TIR domain-containing protein [Saprospiraceae bacterium]
MKLLEYQGLISIWHDRKILPGDEWDHQISQNLEQADIILLLVSSDFIASKYCWDIEIKRAIELHEFRRSVVIPIILRSVDWTLAPFGKLQALPQNAQPITSAASKDDAMRFVSQEVRKVAMELIQKRQKEREMAKKMAAITEYKKMYEDLAAGGKISPVKQFMLDDFQRKMGLTEEDLSTLKEGAPARDNQVENRATYRSAFQRAVEEYGFPLLESIRKDLDLVLDYLGLTHPQVSDIEQQVVQHYKNTQITPPSNPITTPPPSTNPLSTQSNIDYTQLETLLKEEKWELADKRTRTIIYELTDRTVHNGLRIEDIKLLPCEDLVLLNRLWEQL